MSSFKTKKIQIDGEDVFVIYKEKGDEVKESPKDQQDAEELARAMNKMKRKKEQP